MKAPRKLVVLAVASVSLSVVLLPLANRLPLPDGLIGCAIGSLFGLSVLGLLAMAGKARCAS